MKALVQFFTADYSRIFQTEIEVTPNDFWTAWTVEQMLKRADAPKWTRGICIFVEIGVNGFTLKETTEYGRFRDRRSVSGFCKGVRNNKPLGWYIPGEKLDWPIPS